MLACYKKRLTRLRERCHKMGLVPNTSLHEYDQSVLQDMTFKCLVDDIHSFIMFAIPKTGCSSWKSLLVRSMINNLTEKKKFISPHNYPGLIEHAGMYTLKKYNKVMILQRLHSYTVALTVRHPFARLESGFKGKILHLKGKTQEERDVLNYPSAVSLLEDHIDDNFLTETKNIHFKPIYDLAFPCIIPYKWVNFFLLLFFFILFISLSCLSKVLNQMIFQTFLFSYLIKMHHKAGEIMIIVKIILQLVDA